MPDWLVIVGLVLGIACFLAVMSPLVFLANRAIGATFLREAARMKAGLGFLRYSEDGVKLRVNGVAPLAVSVRWLFADVRVDQSALYVMQWRRMWGSQMGQPNIRITWNPQAQVGGFLAAPILERPSIDNGAVVVRVKLRLRELRLRLQARDPRALLDAIHAMS